MRYCEKCNLEVAGNRKYCPLCQGSLEGCGEQLEEVFPTIPTIYHQYNLFFRLLIFTSIVLGVISVITNLMIPQSGWWSFFVVLGIICFWVDLAVAIRKRSSIPKTIIYQVLIISTLAMVWDVVTKWHGWSIDYVLPITCVAALIAMAILANVMHLPSGDFIVYLFIEALFALIPVVFLLTGWVNVKYPSLICIGASFISLAALILFEGENMKKELNKRLHL